MILYYTTLYVIYTLLHWTWFASCWVLSYDTRSYHIISYNITYDVNIYIIPYHIVLRYIHHIIYIYIHILFYNINISINFDSILYHISTLTTFCSICMLIIQIYWYWALSLILCKPFLHPKNSHSPCFEPPPCLRAPSSSSAASAQATLEKQLLVIVHVLLNNKSFSKNMCFGKSECSAKKTKGLGLRPLIRGLQHLLPNL